jgi:glycosyltransferase 2 family protein
MKKRRTLIYLLIAAVLLALVYLQARSWPAFSSDKFRSQLRNLDWYRVVFAVLIINLDYFLRALRWKILLGPAKTVSVASVTAPQFIGFTGMALLGRPAELIRPYLIAKKHDLSMSSQMAVWTVERIFDFGSFTIILIAANLAFGSQLNQLSGYAWFHRVAIPALGLLACMGIVLAMVVRRFSGRIGEFTVTLLGKAMPKMARALQKRIIAFGEGFNTIKGLSEFAQLTAVSLLIWSLIGLAYWQVTHAYRGTALATFSPAHVSLLMGFSVAGGVVQLPFIGGGSQFATITALEKVFQVGPELAFSCGILLWLVTFMSVIPTGLLLARREHVSITSLTKEEEAAESALSAD